MAITLDPATKIFTIPQADLVFVQGTFYSADTNAIKYEIEQLMDNEQYIWMERAINHNTVVTIAGVPYARTLELINGYSIVFTPDAQWSVQLGGSNNNFFDIEEGILNQNQVQVIPTNSAGLQDLSVLLASAYQGQVVVNTTTGQAGTSTPIGTFFNPSSNMSDAITIAETNGIKNIVLGDGITIYEDLTGGYNLIGTSLFNTITIDPTADLTTVSISNMSLTGELDGVNAIKQCNLTAVTNVSGAIKECVFNDTVSLNGDTLILHSYSNVAGNDTPVITGGAGISIQVRTYHGGMQLNSVVDGVHSIEGYGGALTLDSSCTGGEIHVRGAWFEIYDNSGAGCTVHDQRSGVGALTGTQSTQLTEVHERLDLDASKPNTYADDASSIAGADFDLTKTDNGNGTSTVQRS